jgi:hypothetical protein
MMDEAVQDGIGEGGISNDIVPVLEGELAGDEGGSSFGAVFDDLQEIAALGLVQGSQAVIVDGQEVGFLEAVHELGRGAISPGHSQVLDEAREPEIAAGEALAAGGLGEGTGQVGFAGARGAGDEDDLVVADPVAGSQAEDEGAIESPWGAEVQILDGGWEPEFSLAQELGLTAILADSSFPLDEEGEAVLEGQALDIGQGLLFLEGVGHAGEAEFAETGEGLLEKHGSVSQFQGV